MKRKIFSTDAFGRSTAAQDIGLEGKKTHKRSIDRYFSGYEFVQVPKRNGKGMRMERRYTGRLFRQALPEFKCRRLHFLYIGLYIISLGLFFGGLFIDVASNTCWYVMLCMLVPVAFYIWLANTLLAYLPAGSVLKEYEYFNGACRIITACHLVVGGLVLMIFAIVLMFLIMPGSFSALELVRMGMLVAASLLLLVMAVTESKQTYYLVDQKGD